MKDQVTPGPWKFRSEKGYASEIYGRYGNTVCVFDEDPSNADVQLISAAPDLYSALQAMLACCYDRERDDHTVSAVEEAVTAISKAKGEWK